MFDPFHAKGWEKNQNARGWVKESLYESNIISTSSNFQDLLYYTAILGFFYFQNILPPNIILTKNSVRFNFPVIWNSIPDNIKSLQNLNMFKKSLKRYFVDKYS